MQAGAAPPPPSVLKALGFVLATNLIYYKEYATRPDTEWAKTTFSVVICPSLRLGPDVALLITPVVLDNQNGEQVDTSALI